MASLLIGSASACACAHHRRETTGSGETSCHGVDHENTEKVDAPVGGTKIDADCSCFAEQPSPLVVSKTESKKSKASSDVLDVADAVSHLEFSSAATIHSPLPEIAHTFSKSAILGSLLPARAPPRL
ncbi:MAG TPA: hypothetical protein VK612_04640 [Pyrinomonadaceae bacterium]|nr:hypothetical protein [Pyrinomonadaceae bacterium]